MRIRCARSSLQTSATVRESFLYQAVCAPMLPPVIASISDESGELAVGDRCAGHPRGGDEGVVGPFLIIEQKTCLWRRAF